VAEKDKDKNQFRVTESLVKQAKAEEGLVLKVTTNKENPGEDNIGYGSVLTAAEQKAGKFTRGGSTFNIGSFTKEDADKLLRIELQTRATNLNTRFPKTKPRTVGQNDSILLGNLNFGISKKFPALLQAFKDGNLDNISRESFDIKSTAGKESKGLIARRQRERDRFTTPDGQEAPNQKIRKAEKFISFDEFNQSRVIQKTPLAQHQQLGTQAAPALVDPASLLKDFPQEQTQLPGISQAPQQITQAEFAKLDLNTMSDEQIDSLSDKEFLDLQNVSQATKSLGDMSDEQIDALSDEEFLALQQPPATTQEPIGPIPNASRPEDSLTSGIVGPDIFGSSQAPAGPIPNAVQPEAAFLGPSAPPLGLARGQVDPTLSQPPQQPSQGILGQLPSATSEQAGTPSQQPSIVAGLLQEGLAQSRPEDLVTAARHGFDNNLAGQALQLAGLPLDPKVANFKPKGFNEEAIALSTSFIDIGAAAILKAAAPFLKGVSKIVGPSVKLQKKFKKIMEVAERAELGGVDRNKIDVVIKRVSDRMSRAQYRKIAANLGLGGSAVTTADEGLKQIDKGVLDEKRLAGAAAEGLVGGVVLGVGSRAAIRGLGKLSNKVMRAFGVNPKLLIGANVDPQKVANAFETAEKSARSLVKRGLLEPSMANNWKHAIFIEQLEKSGVNMAGVAGQKAPLTFRLGGIVNNIELANSIDKKFGTRLTGSFQRLIMARFAASEERIVMQETFGKAVRTLEKMGIDRHEITTVMQYVESEAGGVVFNPAAEQLSKTFFRPTYKGILPDADQMQQLGIIRQTLDNVAAESGGFSKAVGYLKGYIPLIKKSGRLSKAELKASTSKTIVEPGYTNTRQATHFDPELFETDFTKLAEAYSNAATKHKHLSPVIREAGTEINKLLFMGRTKEAEKMAEQFASGLGIANKVDMRKVFGNQVVDKNADNIRAIAELIDDPNAVSEFEKVFRQTMFDGTVFSSPTVIVKQLLQPELVGTVEVGAAQVARARKLALNKDMRDLAKGFMKFMRQRDPDSFAEIPGDVLVSNPVLKGIQKVSSFFATPGKVPFNRLDQENRIIGFLAGKDAFQREGLASLDGMLFGQKDMIKKVLAEKGEEAASNLAGIIRSQRINFAYTIANTPSAWSQGIGRFIPFTTWGRNQFARLVGDAQEGSVEQIAKRVMIPYAQLTAFKILTGYEIPNAHPLQAVGGLFTADALPIAAEAFEQVGAGRLPTAPITSFASPVKMAKRLHKVATSEDKIGAATGLKPLAPNSVAGKFRKAILGR